MPHHDTGVSLTDISLIATRCEVELPLAAARLHDAYFYSSLSLCVIDAVFSIGARYESTFGTVQRYCAAYDVPLLRASRSQLPSQEAQEPLSALVDRMELLGPAGFADRIGNRQRTSARGGVLKAEAVLSFAKTLRAAGVDYFQDLNAVRLNPALEAALREVRGQRSGVAIQYFWMLAGNEDLIKPDRMVLRFLEDSLSRDVAVSEATDLLVESCEHLRWQHPHLTPRLLDYLIWEHWRTALRARGRLPS